MVEARKISNYEWKIEKRGGMKVPVLIYASEKLLNLMRGDKTLEQAKNVAMLSGIVKKSIVLPDAHQGYGFSIGGVAAFDLSEGIISPGGVGYDINCSVRLLKTNLKKGNVERKRKEVIENLFKAVPSGVGKGGALRVSKDTIKEVLKKGARWAIENGYGSKEDLEYTEENGCMKEAKEENVSDRAIKRGLPQLGSLGAGNHFLEVQYVEKIFEFFWNSGVSDPLI